MVPIGSHGDATFQVTNVSTMTVPLLPEMLPMAPPFAKVSNTCLSGKLDPMQTCSINLRFTPVERGAFEGEPADVMPPVIYTSVLLGELWLSGNGI